MFGNLTFNLPSGPIKPPKPQNVPAPTPVTFPSLQLQIDGAQDGQSTPLVPLLQSICRPTQVHPKHLAALGVHVTPDAPLEALVPDPSILPDFAKWDSLALEDVSVPMNEAERRPLNNGQKSPGIVFYLERKKELTYPNQQAFRTVRRVTPAPGKDMPRLGNSYEFYKQLEAMGHYWDDASDPWIPPPRPSVEAEPKSDKAADSAPAEDDGEGQKGGEDGDWPPEDPDRVTYRTDSGATMPPDSRHNAVSALLRMIVYEFKCNISAARTEPRLHMRAPPSTASQTSAPRASYFPSGCTFGFRTPLGRADARAGVVEGPLFALSSRNTTSFDTDMDKAIDLGREIVAALITAQHRAREGREEQRFGQGAWWCSKPRWGGGTGGPIGKMVDAKLAPDSVAGDELVSGPKEEAVPSAANAALAAEDSGSGGMSDVLMSIAAHRQERLDRAMPPAKMRRLLGFGLPSSSSKKQGVSAFDNYRMVRPPAATWDRKARYMALGKVPGSQTDEVFVVSVLFHHVSFLRVTVPARLLEVLDGAEEESTEEGRSWGGVQVTRSRWLDLFLQEDRLEAIRTIWGIMLWVMREIPQAPLGEDGAATAAGREDRMEVDSRGDTTGESASAGGGDKMDMDGEGERQCKNQ